jgi:putative phage-type endonuclease
MQERIRRIQFQNTEEWLAHRDRIGGSAASAIVGMNPYKTNQELWREKTGHVIPPDISDKPYVKYGHEAEEHIRALFALDFPEYKVEYYDNNMILNDRFPFAHASLDGELIDMKGRRGILEIKTTNILQSMQREKWNEKIPDNYYIQILWYLMVTEYDFAVLVAQLKMDYKDGLRKLTKHYFIEREEVEEDIEYIAEEGAAFWKLVKIDREPGLILPGF